MLKSITRKTWSVLIALVMICTTFCIGQPLTASATVAKSTPDIVSGLCFVVPEAIYLKPVYNSYQVGTGLHTSSTFQWYVNNTLSSTSNEVTLGTGEESQGSIYFRYANASNAKLRFEWLSANGQGLTGGTATIAVGGGTLQAKESSTLDISSSNNAIQITAGTSPDIDTTQTGAYIRWTVTYTDTTDGRQKTVQAYTYMYKPYIQPVGTAHRTINDRGTDHYGQSLAWISGVHDTDASALGSHFPNVSTSYGLAAISSGDSSGTACGNLYAQLPSYFQRTASNVASGNWLNTSSSPQYAPDKSFRYVENKNGPGSGDVAFWTLMYSPTALLTVDISRYSDLSQIPNLSLGLMVTDDESSDKGAALFVSNYTGTATSSDVLGKEKSGWNSAKTLWNQYNTSSGAIWTAGTPDNRTGSETEGIKYNGRWSRAIDASAGTSTYYAGAGYMNYQGGDSIWNISELRMKVTRYDKSALRTAVLKAINNAPTLQSMFYDTSSTAWTSYTDLFRAASMALTKVDGTYSTVTVNGTSYDTIAKLAKALSDAVDAVKSGSGRLTNRTAKQTNVVLQQTGNNSYVYTAFENDSMTHSTTFKTYDTVTFTADNVRGYTFLGLKSASSAPSTTVGSTAPYPDSFTTSASGATIDGGTVTYTHTDTTGTDESGNLYYTYYYLANTYTVKFNANGGTGSMPDQPFTYNVAQDLNANTFTRNGYAFAGWAKSSGGSIVYDDSQNVNNLTTTANGTVNLYAKWTTVTYTIQFDTAGGSIEGEYMTEYDYNTSVTLPNAFKNGYSLTGWRANDLVSWGGMTYDAGASVSNKYGNVVFTAVWKANNYNVEFNANGGSGATMTNQSFVYGTAQALKANAYTRDGYTFRGWALTSTATDPLYLDKDTVNNLTTVPNETVTLFAVWGANTYTIIYSTDSGTIRDASYTRTFTVNDQIGLPTNVEKTGYNFTGWKPANSVGTWNADTIYTGTINSGMIGGVTLQAQWSVQGYTIDYVLLDGTFIGTRYTTTYDITSAITLPSARKTGYTFNGWLSDGAGNWGTTTYAASNYSAGRYGDVTMTAQWTGVQYYVQFNGNGATSGVMYNQSFTYGESATLNPNEYVRGGYQFVGWATSSASSSPAVYADGALVSNLSVTAGGTFNLFAVWQQDTYTITYDAAGGTIVTLGMTQYTITETITLPVARRTGYTLQNWVPEENSGSWHTWDTYTGSVAAGSYGNVKLVAQWSKDTYTITYDPKDGTMSGTYTTTYDIDTTIVLPSVTRTGYIFGGWLADAAWNNVTVTDTAPAGALGNVKLTAQWTQQIYYVRFNSNGGSGTMSDQLMHFGESKALTRNQFTRDGYNFGGWATSEDGSASYMDGDIVNNLSQTNNGVVNLFAVWTARNFTLQYDLNGADAQLRPQTVTMGGTLNALRGYDQEETVINSMPYAFLGWAYTKTAAGNGVVSYENRASFTLNEEVLAQADVDWSTTKPTITLYAVWQGVEIKLVAGEGSTTVIDVDRGLIYGLTPGILRSQFESECLSVIGSGRLVLSSSMIGTGTVVRLVSNITDEVLEEYTIVIFGDLNGDGFINGNDVSTLRSINAHLIEEYEQGTPQYYAADLTHDGIINSYDVKEIRSANAKLTEIDQTAM